MNTPVITHNTHGKWYCSVVILENPRIRRYLSPEGWRKNAHYYEDKCQVDSDIAKFPTSQITPPSHLEIAEYEDIEYNISRDKEYDY